MWQVHPHPSNFAQIRQREKTKGWLFHQRVGQGASITLGEAKQRETEWCGVEMHRPVMHFRLTSSHFLPTRVANHYNSNSCVILRQETSKMCVSFFFFFFWLFVSVVSYKTYYHTLQRVRVNQIAWLESNAVMSSFWEFFRGQSLCFCRWSSSYYLISHSCRCCVTIQHFFCFYSTSLCNKPLLTLPSM